MAISDHPSGIGEFDAHIRELANKLPIDRIFLEIGNYQGGTAEIMMRAIADSGIDRWLITIDPYGSLPYILRDRTVSSEEVAYNEDTYRQAMADLYALANELNVKYVHYRMKSLDWVKLQPPLFDKGKQVDMKFGLVYLDGAHLAEIVRKEYDYFKDKSKSIVIDDWNWMSPNKLLNFPGVRTEDDRFYVSL